MSALQTLAAGQLALPRTLIDHPSGFLALSPRNEIFCPPGGNGFISFRVFGKHAFIVAGLHAPAHEWSELLSAFEQHARAQGLSVAALQVPEAQVETFARLGYTVNQFGSTFAVDLSEFSYAGKRRVKLRNKIKRARNADLVVSEVGNELPRNAKTFQMVEKISRKWIAAKKKKELDVMIGELGDAENGERRVFIVQDRRSEPVAFITYVPVWGRRPGMLHDLTRKCPDAGPGAMELCNSVALDRFVEEGVPFLHFGFTPFIVDDAPDNPGSSRAVAWIIAKLRKHGRAIYPAESQVAYKSKWGADLVDREYLAAKPLGLRAIWDLLRVTRSV